jgi:hypothetical protein
MLAWLGVVNPPWIDSFFTCGWGWIVFAWFCMGMISLSFRVQERNKRKGK